MLEVTQWRGSGREREGLVKWAGPYLATWEPASSLTSDLQQEGRIKRTRVSKVSARPERERVSSVSCAE